ncbi:MAG: hypothetical protein MJ072_06050, partial [Clostridia bacterium]|nr:hypothetical protein [Clostridia bacterium]
RIRVDDGYVEVGGSRETGITVTATPDENKEIYSLTVNGTTVDVNDKGVATLPIYFMGSLDINATFGEHVTRQAVDVRMYSGTAWSDVFTPFEGVAEFSGVKFSKAVTFVNGKSVDVELPPDEYYVTVEGYYGTTVRVNSDGTVEGGIIRLYRKQLGNSVDRFSESLAYDDKGNVIGYNFIADTSLEGGQYYAITDGAVEGGSVIEFSIRGYVVTQKANGSSVSDGVAAGTDWNSHGGVTRVPFFHGNGGAGNLKLFDRGGGSVLIASGSSNYSYDYKVRIIISNDAQSATWYLYNETKACWTNLYKGTWSALNGKPISSVGLSYSNGTPNIGEEFGMYGFRIFDVADAFNENIEYEVPTVEHAKVEITAGTVKQGATVRVTPDA